MYPGGRTKSALDVGPLATAALPAAFQDALEFGLVAPVACTPVLHFGGINVYHDSYKIEVSGDFVVLHTRRALGYQ